MWGGSNSHTHTHTHRHIRLHRLGQVGVKADIGTPCDSVSAWFKHTIILIDVVHNTQHTPHWNGASVQREKCCDFVRFAQMLVHTSVCGCRVQWMSIRFDWFRFCIFKSNENVCWWPLGVALHMWRRIAFSSRYPISALKLEKQTKQTSEIC